LTTQTTLKYTKFGNENKKIEFFLRIIPIAIVIKEKHIHQLTAYIWLRLFAKASTQIATQLQICRNIMRNSKNIFLELKWR